MSDVDRILAALEHHLTTKADHYLRERAVQSIRADISHAIALAESLCEVMKEDEPFVGRLKEYIATTEAALESGARPSKEDIDDWVREYYANKR